MFRFTKEGQLQSLDLMYAFFLGLAVLFVNFLLSNRVTILFEDLFTNLSRAGKNALDIVVPAILCALIAALLFRIIRKKKIVLMAYWFTFVAAVVIVIAMAVEYDRDTAEVLFPAFMGIFVVPAAAGAATVTPLFLRWHHRRQNMEE